MNAIKNFEENKNIHVLFISLTVGNAGLDLSVANNVFLVDPW